MTTTTINKTKKPMTAALNRAAMTMSTPVMMPTITIIVAKMASLTILRAATLTQRTTKSTH